MEDDSSCGSRSRCAGLGEVARTPVTCEIEPNHVGFVGEPFDCNAIIDKAIISKYLRGLLVSHYGDPDYINTSASQEQVGTREAAFVHAISAAGVSHAVTRACSSGRLVRCGCDRTVRQSASEAFKWSGCSDNIAYGTAFSKSFVDVNDVRQARGKSDPRAIMNLHNNEAGRKAIEYKMRKECKCHGASGSCQTKTCWRAMPEFRLVGANLKNKFDSAAEVRAKKTGKRTKLIPINNMYKPYSDVDLIYMNMSPDFCEPNDKTGTLGTHGRECNKTSKDVDGCELLCCGRGYRKHVQRLVERCHCKFHWCCHVSCKLCESDVEVHECM